MKHMKNKQTEIPAEIWLDYIEGELEKSFKEDLDRVLVRHVDHKNTVQTLKHLKKNLNDVPMELPGEEVFSRLKSGIMEAVEKVTPLPKKSPWRIHNRVLAVATAAMCVIVLGALFTQVDLPKRKVKGKLEKISPEEQLISENINQNLDLYNNLVMDQQISEDFIQGAMVEKLSQMPEGQASKVIEELK